MMIRASCRSSCHYDDHPAIMMIIMALWWSLWLWHYDNAMMIILALWWLSCHGICWSSHEERMTSFSSLTLVAFKVAKPQQSAKPDCYRYVITLLPSNSQTVSRHSTPFASFFPLECFPKAYFDCELFCQISTSYKKNHVTVLDVNHCLETDWFIQEMFNV